MLFSNFRIQSRVQEVKVLSLRDYSCHIQFQNLFNQSYGVHIMPHHTTTLEVGTHMHTPNSQTNTISRMFSGTKTGIIFKKNRRQRQVTLVGFKPLIHGLYVSMYVCQHVCVHAFVYPQGIKTHGSESRGQEEATCMHVFRPMRPLQ